MRRNDTPPFTLVSASAGDGDAMRELARDAYGMYVQRIGREPAPMTADYAAIAASGRGLLAWNEVVLAGMLVTRLEEDALLIENVAVSPMFQGRGLGAALLVEAERIARDHGLGSVRLYTNEAMTENLSFYSQHGFVETHRASDDGFRRVFFAKRIEM